MSDDICIVLRNPSLCVYDTGKPCLTEHDSILAQAADEIERLRRTHPVACVGRIRELETALETRTETADGLTWRLANALARIDELAAAVSAEREACAVLIARLAEDPFIDRKSYAEHIRARGTE